MLELRQQSRLISNVIDLGPIVYLKNMENTEFNQQVGHRPPDTNLPLVL